VGGRRIQIVDEWCVGFLKGTRIDRAGWKPLKRERPELLKPIELFGSKAGWRELEAGGDEVMHRRWSPKIPPAVRAIHGYWIRIGWLRSDSFAANLCTERWALGTTSLLARRLFFSNLTGR
jgi:hypothetical protein